MLARPELVISLSAGVRQTEKSFLGPANGVFICIVDELSSPAGDKREKKKKEKGTVTQHGKDFSSQNQHTPTSKHPTAQQPTANTTREQDTGEWAETSHLVCTPASSRTCLGIVPSTLSPLCCSASQHADVRTSHPSHGVPVLCWEASERSTDQWGCGAGWLAVVICTSYVVASHTNATRTALESGLATNEKIGKYWRDHRSGRTFQIVLYFIFIVRGFPHAGKGGKGGGRPRSSLESPVTYWHSGAGSSLFCVQVFSASHAPSRRKDGFRYGPLDHSLPLKDTRPHRYQTVHNHLHCRVTFSSFIAPC